MSVGTGVCRRWLVVLVGALSLVGAALPAGAAPTCQGQALTLPEGRLNGTAGPDVMLGTAGDDTMNGRGGDDVICGGGGNDRLNGGGGNDILAGDDGNDSLYGQDGCDAMLGGSGNDLLSPGAQGYCTVDSEGGGGRDRLVVTSIGRADFFGGPGRDTLDARKAPIEMFADLGLSFIQQAYSFSGAARSTLMEVEVIFGSAYSDVIAGDDGPNDLRGFGGNDELYGEGGDDRLVGGDGTDIVRGGDGHDICEGEDMQSCND